MCAAFNSVFNSTFLQLSIIETCSQKLALINNPGIGSRRRKRDDSLTALRDVYNGIPNTNLTSVAVVTAAFLPHLQASKSPKVVHISSGLGSIESQLTKKLGRGASYGSSKVGMNGVAVHMHVAE